jgi:zinc protease
VTTRLRQGLEASRTVLANGLVVISKEAHTVEAATIQLSVRAGSIYESDDEIGLSHLMSRTIDRGTQSRTSRQIAEELDARGVTLTTSANRHVMTVGCTCLSEDFESLLELMSDVVMNPSFPDEELATRKGQILTAIRQDEDSPAAQAVQRLFEILYPSNHPYGRPAKGRADTVERLSRSTLLGFHRARFAPANLTAIIVGDVAKDRAMAVCSRVFDQWSATAAAEIMLAHPASRASRTERVITMMNKAQADIAYGFTTIVRSDPSYYAYALMNNALGQYGIGGRLGDNIRERQGMAYYVYSSFDANVVEGPLLVRAGVNPTNVERAIAAIDGEVSRMAAEGLTTQELADCKEYLIGSIPRMLETNQAIATFLQTAEFFNLGLDHDSRLPDLLNAVTLEDVHAAARRSLDISRAALVVAGPYRQAETRTAAG